MKIIDRYITSSILKSSLSALAICTFMIVAVEMFSSMNNYVTKGIGFSTILYLSFLGIPEYLMMAASVSFLFGTTFFFSQLEGNNEMIMLSNSGLSYRRICRPVIIMMIIITLFFSLFCETVMIDATVEHDRLSVELFGQTSTQDSLDITLSDVEGRYVITSQYYSRRLERLFNVEAVEIEEGRIKRRVSADYADYNGTNWVFHDGRMYTMDEDNIVSEAAFYDEYDYSLIDTSPSMFTDQSRNISTMAHRDAMSYLQRVRNVDKGRWAQAATEYISRLFEPFSIFVLVVISLMMNYRFKKNVFLFSIIQSLCTAVVYYVVQMLVVIMCNQAMIPPVFSVIIPVATVMLLSLGIRLTGKLNG